MHTIYRFLSLLLLGSIFHFVGNTDAADKIIAYDEAVFKIEDSTYLYSDILVLSQDINFFGCSLGEDSLFLRSIGWTESKKISLPRLDAKKTRSKFSKDQRAQIEQLILVAKIINSVNKQKILVNSSLKRNLKRLAKENRCISSQREGVGRYINDLMKSEIYLKLRFNRESVWASQKDLIEFKKRYPGKSAKQLSKAATEKLVLQAINNYFSSLDMSTPYEWFR